MSAHDHIPMETAAAGFFTQVASKELPTLKQLAARALHEVGAAPEALSKAGYPEAIGAAVAEARATSPRKLARGARQAQMADRRKRKMDEEEKSAVVLDHGMTTREWNRHLALARDKRGAPGSVRRRADGGRARATR